MSASEMMILEEELNELRTEVEKLSAEALEREERTARIMLEAERHRRIADEAVERIESAETERAAVVAYLRKQANAPHPIERGVPSLSPAGRGLLLFHADAIERGEHRKEES